MKASVSICLIVRNEEKKLAECLMSVRDVAPEIVVADTGSTDRTKEIAETHGARVINCPWQDSFSIARNDCQQHATGDWVFWIDADEKLDNENRIALASLFRSLTDQNIAYLVKWLCLPSQTSAMPGTAQLDEPGLLTEHIRLFRRDPNHNWQYRVHEQIFPSLLKTGAALQNTNVLIEHTGYHDSAMRAMKLLRNVRLLQLDYADKPCDPFVTFYLGWAYLDLGRAVEARQLLERSLHYADSSNSFLPKLYALLAKCHIKLRQPKKSLDVSILGRALFPGDAEIAFWEGVSRRHLGDLEGAERCFIQLLSSLTTSNGLHLGDRCLISKPQIIQDRKIRRPTYGMEEDGLKGYKTLHQLALICYQQHRFVEAEELWQASLNEQPNFLASLVGLGNLYLDHKRWGDLETLIGRLESCPQWSFQARLLTAQRHLARCEFSAATSVLSKLISEEPDHVVPRIYMTHAFLGDGKDPSACERGLNEVLEIDPNHADSWGNLIKLLRNQGRHAEALRTCRAASLHVPSNYEFRFLEAAILREMGDRRQLQLTNENPDVPTPDRCETA